VVTSVILVVGLWLFGTGEGLLVVAHLGVSPWTVLAQGSGKRIGIGPGLATFCISVIVLLLWIPLRERPGLGTIANAVIIALALGVTAQLPRTYAIGGQLAEVFAGIALIGIGSGLYLTTGLGPGPRDGWMTGLHKKTGLPVTVVRLGIEVTVFFIGWALGGVVGVGTALFALLIGPTVGYGLALAGRVSARLP
jgi:uncharacterized membrane protein YczE